MMQGDRLMRPTAPTDASSVSSEDTAELLASGRTEALCALAGDRRAAPEILFVLSQASSEAVRAKVASNPATPAVVDSLLLNDAAAEVRAQLGRKIARLLPHFAMRSRERLRDAAAAKLLLLAQDMEVAVRRALAAEVARLECAPRDVIMTLVRDLDELVSVPVAEFSPLLDDDDLIALIGEGPSAATLAAFARREGLGSDVADRLVATGDVTVIATLLRNSTTQIREATLDDLVERARSVQVWHEPLVGRPELTERLIAKLSQFVADNLIGQLAGRGNLSPQLYAILERRMRKRKVRPLSGSAPSERDIVGAIERSSAGAVLAALSQLANVNADAVRHAFAVRKPEAIVALAWRAGLSMETAVKLQEFPGRVPHTIRLAANDDGSYPLSPDALKEQLASLGISDAD